jgi:hypothetical protein
MELSHISYEVALVEAARGYGLFVPYGELRTSFTTEGTESTEKMPRERGVFLQAV